MTLPINPSLVDPELLARLLREAGFHLAGQRTGVYTRLFWPGETAPRGRSILIPLDETAPEHGSLMTAVLLELVDAARIGCRIDAVLTVADDQPADLGIATPLDYAMFTVWLEGNWTWVTKKMTTEAREAAVAAVLRYDRSAKAADQNEEPLTRESLAWWD